MTEKTQLTAEDVDNIAQLARLSLTSQEREMYRRQLSAILDYVHELQALDTSAIEAAFRVLPLPPALREDEVRASIPVDDALANAPQRHEDYFQMPRILEEE